MQPESDREELHGEIERLTELLDEMRRAQRASADHAEDLARTAAFDTAEAERLRNELKLFKEDASRFSREDDKRIRRLEREKQEAERKIKRLKLEVGELRSVIKRYVGELQDGYEGEGSSALHTELHLVRQRAETDLNKMREQLESRQLNGHADAAELDQLRQELDEQQRDASAQRDALELATREQTRLREEIEERCSEIQRQQRALESAREEIESIEFGRREEAEARKQAERGLNDAQQQIDRLKLREGRPGRNQAPGATNGAQPVGIGLNALSAALIAFLLADGIALFSGKGELISGLIEGRDAQPVYQPQLKKPEEIPQAPLLNAPAGSGATANRPVDAAPVAEHRVPPVPPLAKAATRSRQPANGSTIRDRLNSGILGPVMAYVRGGEFMMGQALDQLAKDEQPVRSVSMSSFAIGKYEVTFAEYRSFAQATGRKLPSDNGWGRGRRPVINVTWEDAVAYTRWLSQQTGERYRLPSESEWEFAARGGSDSFYWWGYELEENRASCFDCGSRWDGKSTAPVGSFSANAFGISDTAGNVMEWVQDCYRDSYWGAPVDGSPRQQRECQQLVARGGAYNKPGDSLHSTRRFHFQSDTRLPTLGFRVARDI